MHETDMIEAYEFDATLWRLLKRMSYELPGVAAKQFGISPKTVALIAQAREQKLQVLASGVILSFKLESDEETLIARLESHYDPLMLVNRTAEHFDATYWLLLNRAAVDDVKIAKERFGVSLRLVQAVAQANHSRLKHLASSIVSRFSLRFSEDVIVEYLSGSNVTYALLKKFSQSLIGGRCK
jgi:hypothetical protein